MHPIYLHITAEAYDGARLRLAGAAFHHLARVRRVCAGTPLRAALPDGRLLAAEVAEIGADHLIATVTGVEAAPGIPPCRITLYQAVLKGEKMEFVVQKAAELGAASVVPIVAARSIPRWDTVQALERAARWQRIADAAAGQCERVIPPHITPPCALAEIGPLPALTLLLHEREGARLPALACDHPGAAEVGLCIGPEGGWTPAEAAALRVAGARPIHLGGRILRAETAAVAALTLAQYLWGDLSG